MENLRKIGYDILINHFEPFLRKYVSEVLINNFGDQWRNYITNQVKERLQKERKINIDSMEIDGYFEELLFSDLKKIISRNYIFCEDLLGDLVKAFFIQVMNELNRIRIRTVHPKENFSNIDIDNIKRDIKSICRGVAGKPMVEFINNYEDPHELNLIEIVDPGENCVNNLPSADYDLDGGFVGRKKEIKEIKNKIYSTLDRIITIMGAGGVGKTALALEVAKRIVEDEKNPFRAIIWFSAKEERLTDIEIVKIDPSIKNLQQLLNDVLQVIDKIAYENYQEVDVPIEYCVRYLYKRFEEFDGEYLLIIDNLETILENEPLIRFIEDAPCKLLITSRIGLGKLERPYQLKELIESDSVTLFKNVSEAKNLQALLELGEDRISDLVNRLKRFPLAVKWSIGQFSLGHDIEKAFPKKLPGESLISQFSFDNIFSLFDENEKLLLYAIHIWDGPISVGMLEYLTEIDEIEFNIAIRKLKQTSFIFLVELNTKYSILSLTSDYIEKKLEKDEKIRVLLQNKKHNLISLIEESEKIETLEDEEETSKRKKQELITSLGIKTPEEKIAFNFVKNAKEFASIHDDDDKATEFYEKALRLAPNLAYTYGEYSKFEFYKKKNQEKSLILAKRSIELEPENFHHWISYGRMLRINGKTEESVKVLEKALELNPKHLRTLNQLGRSYTYNKNFKKADEQLQISQEKAKTRNKQFYVVALTFRIDNFTKWAKDSFSKNDFSNVTPQLDKAKKLVKMVFKVEPNNKFMSYYKREILFTFGLSCEEQEEYNSAQGYYFSAVGKIFDIEDEKIYNDVIARSYYHIALVREKLGHDRNKSLDILEKGLKNCKKKTEIYQKLKSLKENLSIIS